MATNANLVPTTIGEEQVLTATYTVAGSGNEPIRFNTKNTFVDKDIQMTVSTPAAGNVSLDVTDSTDNLAMGEANEGFYYPTATINGNASVETAGWLNTGDNAVSEAGVQVGKVAQSVLKNGNTGISSGAAIIPNTTTDQTINITEGYNAARTVVVKSQSAGQAATVNGSNVTVDAVTFTPGASNVAISGTATIDAPVVSQDGYISETIGTKNSSTATVNATVDLVTVGVTPSVTTKTVKPVVARTAITAAGVVDAASGAATTTAPAAGAYVAVDVAAISDSLTVEGKVSGAGYGDATHFGKDAATTITVGSEAADTAYVPIAAGTVASGTAEVDTVDVAYNSEAGNFSVTGAADIPAPTASTAGFVGSGIGTLTGATDGATVDASIAKIGIAANLTGTGTYKPVIAKNAATNVESSPITTTQPAAGTHYVAVDTAAVTGTVAATAAVTSAGYGTTTAGQYTTTASSDLTVGAQAADVAYIPIAGATFTNAAASGETYSDISSTAPILISGDYLYIKKGYTDSVKISLAQLVPDDATITASTGAQYLLQGQSGYTSAGELVVGTIPTYDGSYVIG